MKPELRKDYIQDRYVLIAPQRKNRPHDIERHEVLNKNEDASCIFCPEQIDKQEVVAKFGPRKKWYTAVIKNKYPAVHESFPKAYGTQEVVIETPDPHTDLKDLPEEHIAKIFETYAHRTRAISNDKKIEYIITFKNNGGKAGASIRHSHSQIFASAFLPPHLFDKSQKALAYKLKHGTSVYQDIIEKELEGKRHIWHDDNVIAFCPYASFHNYEAWIMPFREVDNITQLNAEERLSMAKILKKILKQISALHMPYNFYFHQVINDENQHFYIKVTPRGSVWAGVEIGSGLIINPLAPEEAAKYYKKGL